MIKKLFTQASHYFSGNILSMLPHFITFPIFTRVLATGDYGTLNLLTLTLTLATSIACFGLQHAAVRFYSDFQKGKSDLVPQYYSTLLFSSLILGVIWALVYLLSLRMNFLPSSIFSSNALGLYALLSILIPLRCGITICLQFLRAGERSKLYNLFEVLSAYAGLGLTLFFLFYIIGGLIGILCGMVLSNVLSFIFIFFTISKSIRIRLRSFSFSFLRRSVHYGLPLVFVELGHTLLNLGDRYLIQYYSGPVLLGIYAAGYNVINYVAEVVILPFRSAITPIYLRIWSSEGRAPTERFLSNSLTFFLLIMIPVGFGFVSVSQEFIGLLASAKYKEAYIIGPWVMAGFVIYGSRIFFDSPLYIYRRTWLILILMSTSCALNIGLNIFLIPKYGIVGAGMSTLFANTFYIIILILCSTRSFKFKIRYGRIFLYILSSTIMFLTIKNINIGTIVVTLFVKMLTGMIIYSLLVLLLDKELRYKVKGLIPLHFPFTISK